ncbi:MAG: alpha/beta fold hydrolase [Gemmatimonadales bacterium]|nr:MAG: alpha/beta fold hydrolase [Gemmatimonadales bacterium]
MPQSTSHTGWRWPHRRLPLLAAVVLVALLALEPAVAPGGEGVLHAQTPPSERIRSDTHVFQVTGDTIEFAYFQPSVLEETDDPRPLLVLLHGLGSTPAQVIRYQGIVEEAEDRGWIVLAPMGFNRRGWYGSLGPGRPSGMGVQADDPDNLGELSQLETMAVVELALERFPVDRDRIYLMGHSMGGAGALHLGREHPDLWAGIAAVAPAVWAEPLEWARDLRHLPIHILQGTEDRLVPVRLARGWAEAMADLDMTFRYMEVDGGDHTAIIARTPQHVREIFDFLEQATPP